MRALVVYCHPCEESFNRAVLDTVLGALGESGHEVRLIDLYESGFDPVMSPAERRGYHTPHENEAPVADHLALLKWAEILVFVYPTWWFGLPAMLKGWCDRVFVPHATFEMPDESSPMGPKLTNIRKIAVFTTCGASWWMSKFVGEPGRRTILRGIRWLCHPKCKTCYAAHYKMDTSTPDSRARYLNRVYQLCRLMTCKLN
ncbi:NAD(P)H-dependent oxidoreductase [Microbaculum marinisediminis]|uniref:NAD(P)H-dependent oxidoreductase n=1 Tax=Microbaculum marinisediminis TaxID=2931392 RepID=A0AAW5QYT6_9HYPH|nr:NAD(P)H-dependent oxidoreductase [Microbaculum sp. A6E488]MCT8971563.1 NAD(P)H-dependent oxidoreductase [Microbaculum sp. A6E488]